MMRRYSIYVRDSVTIENVNKSTETDYSEYNEAKLECVDVESIRVGVERRMRQSLPHIRSLIITFSSSFSVLLKRAADFLSFSEDSTSADSFCG